jgi:retron-type reverse transcriptase
MSNILNLWFTESKLRACFNEHIKKSTSMGVDGQSAEHLCDELDAVIPVIVRKVNNGSFRFSAYKEVLIEKGPDQAPRVICIPTNRDKLVIRLLMDILQEQAHKGEAINNQALSIVKDIKRQMATDVFNSFIKLDIKQFYPSVDHTLLFEKLAALFNDEKLLALLKASLNNRVQSAINHKNYSPNPKDSIPKGLPQGLAISGILSDIYLKNIDQIKLQEQHNIAYYRFVDDVLVLCKKTDKNTVSQHLTAAFQALKLTVHDAEKGSDKSDDGDIANGFQYLGYEMSPDIFSVRKSSEQRLYQRINRLFILYHSKQSHSSLTEFYERINKTITGINLGNGKLIGWIAYFRYTTDHQQLFRLDHFVKQCCKRYDIPYDQQRIKKFSRAVYEINRHANSHYLAVYTDVVCNPFRDEAFDDTKNKDKSSKVINEDNKSRDYALSAMQEVREDGWNY